MVAASLGSKRTCASCGLRFFDLGKAVATCPKCGAEQAAIPPRLKPGTYKPFDKAAKAKAISHVEAPSEAAEEVEDEDAEDDDEEKPEDDIDDDDVDVDIQKGVSIAPD